MDVNGNHSLATGSKFRLQLIILFMIIHIMLSGKNLPYPSFDVGFVYYSHGKKRDIELRTKIYAAGKRKLKKHVCGDVKLDAMFIDARTMDEDLPWDETDDFKSGGITKNTPL